MTDPSPLPPATAPYASYREDLLRLLQESPGKTTAWYVAAIMRASRGKANPHEARRVLRSLRQDQRVIARLEAPEAE